MSKEKYDETANEYKVHLTLSEWMAEQMGLLQMEDLVEQVETKTDFIQYITSRFPELKGFDKENQKEISSALKKFQLKEILKYLKTSMVSRDVGNFFTKIIPEYSRSSTFTHGGPYSSTIVNNLAEKNAIIDEIERIASISFTCVSLAKQNVIFAYKLPPEEMIKIMQGFEEIRSSN